MKKNQKIMMWVGIGLIASVGGYFLYKKFSKPGSTSREISEEEEEEVIEQDIPSSTPTKAKFPLENGSRGAEVKILQQYLNRAPMCKRKMPVPGPNSRVAKILPLAEDGIFGPMTKMALEICYTTAQVNEDLYNRMKKALPTLSV